MTLGRQVGDGASVSKWPVADLIFCGERFRVGFRRWTILVRRPAWLARRRLTSRPAPGEAGRNTHTARMGTGVHPAWQAAPQLPPHRCGPVQQTGTAHGAGVLPLNGAGFRRAPVFAVCDDESVTTLPQPL